MAMTARWPPRRSFTRWYRKLEKGFLVRGSSPSGLRQGRSQPPVPRSGSSTFSFAGAFIVAGTDCCPGCQMMTVGKRSFWTHVHSCFCQDAGCRSWLNSGYGTGQFHLLRIGLEALRNFLVQFLDHLLDVTHVAQTLTIMKRRCSPVGIRDEGRQVSESLQCDGLLECNVV
jgi:hypothetical protein